MKLLLVVLAAITCTACNNKQPFTVPLDPQQVWVDEATKNDTIITGEGYGTPNYLYFAAKNWQSPADTNLSHGYRQIAIRYNDSILVKPLSDLSTNYDGPFFLKVSDSRTILQAQNFLDTSVINPARIFIPLQ